MTDVSRRELLALLGASLAATADAVPEERTLHPLRVRTITAGVELASVQDLAAVERALARITRARKRVEEAGYEVQTVRVATNPIVAALDEAQRASALPALEKIDAAAAAAGAVLSIGPILTADRFAPELGKWGAELARRAKRISFSVSVTSAERGLQPGAVRTAAQVIADLARVDASGVANFRFAAAAGIPAGTPFFPVAHHQGPDSLALGLEAAGLVESAFAGATDAEDAERRLRDTLDSELQRIERLGAQLAADEHVHFLGIDPSPAPGMDRSIGAAIETLTRVPFGHASTLQACAVITAALKSLNVRTCGYAGLMLPVLEDPVLAKRASEGRYGLQELLLYSTVCGTGLDVVPLPGDISVDALARIVGDMGALSARLRKPLSARLFPVPGRKAGELARFDDPLLTECRVFESL
ncbi:MAG TPA: DUF711 family protein [Steroidobacteraceae bacterium]|nr:DUF711 family protein [Steroidobacteraceae bacterium]